MRVLRSAAGLFGELIITLGLVLILFVGWQLVWTDVVSEADAANVVNTLEREFAESTDTPAPTDPPGTDPNTTGISGDAYAIVRIPRFGSSYARPLYQGTTSAALQRGIGHYANTNEPGEVGNFAMAAHRGSYGKPFDLIEELKVGDAVVIETSDAYFVYRITRTEIVPPSQSSVLLPVPNDPGAAATRAILTMTTCHPRFSSRQRYVAFGVLTATYPHAEGVPSDVLQVS